MDEMVNHYEILELNSDCTCDQIKHNFRQLALKYHPDKQNQQQFTQSTHRTDLKFKQIETAYRILTDDNSRRRYDAEFSLMKANLPIINEQITVDDLKQNDDCSEKDDYKDDYKYNCRCGGHYRLTEEQYDEMIEKFNKGLIVSYVLSCDTCSLFIRIVQTRNVE